MAEYSEYKDSGQQWLGMVPSHWKVDKISAHFQERKTTVSDIDFKPLSVTKNGVVPQLDTAAKSDNGDNRKLVKKGDFVVNSRSDRKGSCGFSELDGSVSVIYIVATPIDVNGKFYHYLFRSNNYVEEFYRNGHGIVADLWTTRYDEMKNIQIPIPPTEEQEAIVAYLDQVTADIDKAIAAKERIIASLEERRKIIITHAVAHGINSDTPMKDSGIDWLGEIPAHWDIKRFKNIAQVKANLVPPQRYYDYPQVSPDCIEKGTGRLISYQTVKESGVISDNHLFFKGQIVYSKIRPNLNKLIIAPFDGLCSADMYPIETNENIIYLQYLMLSGIFVSQVSAVIAERVKMPKINKTELGEIRIPIPSEDEQTEIVNYLKSSLEPIEVAVSKERKLIDLLRERKNIIINETVTGKVKVI